MSRSDALERKERAEEVNYLFASCTAHERNLVRYIYRECRRRCLLASLTLAQSRAEGWARQARAEALYVLQQITLR